MTNRKNLLDRLSSLTWNDLENWAGSKIVSRGKNYQRQGSVSGLAETGDGGLVAWVEGTKRYFTKVDQDGSGMLRSICSCPYEFDCKHGVAIVLEYLERYRKNQDIPEAKPYDDRLRHLDSETRYGDRGDEDWVVNERSVPEDIQKEIDLFLKGKTKSQLVELIRELAQQYPEIEQALSNRKQLISGHIGKVTARLRREIRETGSEPGWRDYWQDEGFTPDYSGIRVKLETLVKEGYADEVLALGEELLVTGAAQIEMSHDEGETAMEISHCVPVIVEALDRSSHEPVDKLNRALDALFEDQYEVCGEFAEYLHRRHPASAWHAVADRLLAHLNGMDSADDEDDFSRDYARDRLSDWAIHALEQAGRKDEIIPLCEAEAKRTNSYVRLVKRLVADRRYEDAERWIQEGLRAQKGSRPGIGKTLREQLMEVHSLEGNRHGVAAIQAEEFVRHPSRKNFTDCRSACDKIKAWPKVRHCLLEYLETGELPWRHEDWPLPKSGLDPPEAERADRFPITYILIDIAVLEKKPDQVLLWYDRLIEEGAERHGVNEDEIAQSVQEYAPERAVGIWKDKAHRLIAEVKPKAYREAARYLRKAAVVMARLEKQPEWDRYLETLRKEHWRKRRLIEVLDVLEGRPIVKRRR